MASFGQRGFLRLSFFNDRLIEAWFYADDPDALLAAMGEPGLAFDRFHRVEHGSVRIAARDDAAGHRYVNRQDVRLAAQLRRWIRRYA